MKINELDKKAIAYFLKLNNSILEKKVLNSWAKNHNRIGTAEQARVFVNNSKDMLQAINQNDEINSNELKITIAKALSEYAEKLGENIKKLSRSDFEVIGKKRDEKLDVENRRDEFLK